MFIRRLWSFVSLVGILSCGSIPLRPNLDRADCLARNDCYVVIVDNTSGQFAADIRINNKHYGDVSSYSKTTFSLFADLLKDGNCAFVSVKFINAPYNPPLTSSEECIYPGQYYQVDITHNQHYIWLTPFKVNEKLMK